MKKKKEIVNLISKGEIKEGMSSLLKIIPKDKKYLKEEVLLFSSQFNSWEKEHLKGMNPPQEQRNRIIAGLISVINSLDDKYSEDIKERVVFQIEIEADYEDKNTINEIIKKIIDLSEDTSLSILRIEKGSIKLTIESNKEAYEKLIILDDNDELSKEIGKEIQKIELISTAEEYYSMQNIMSPFTGIWNMYYYTRNQKDSIGNIPVKIYFSQGNLYAEMKTEEQILRGKVEIMKNLFMIGLEDKDKKTMSRLNLHFDFNSKNSEIMFGVYMQVNSKTNFISAGQVVFSKSAVEDFENLFPRFVPTSQVESKIPKKDLERMILSSIEIK